MKKIKWTYILAVTISLATLQTRAQNVAINEDGSAANVNAILDVKSNSKGILIPRVSSSVRKNIPNTKGLLVYDSTFNSFWYNTGTDWQNISTGTTGWLVTGNIGLGPNSYIGTNDSSALQFRVDGAKAGSMDVFENVFLGIRAGLNNQPMVTGFSFSGVNNTALGGEAMRSNVSGEGNVAIGNNSLTSSVMGNNNTAVGGSALSNNLAGNNTAVGFSTLSGNTTGVNNTASGVSAMNNTTTGQANTAYGVGALNTNTTGTGNTAIGFASDVATGNLSNATAIGDGAVVNASNKVRIGNSSVTVIEGQVPFTTPSDGRFKYQVREDVAGLDFILQLRPVTYQFDVKRFDEQGGNPNGAKETRQVSDVIQTSYDNASRIRRSGFIAQEVEQAANASGYDFSGIIKPATDKEHYGLSYESFVVPMVKAIQEQQKIIEELKKEIEALKQRSK
jgi:trimeric autotransporter adhesin